MASRRMLNLLAEVLGLGLGAADRVAQTAVQPFISVWQFLASLAARGSVEILPDEVAGDPVRLLAEVDHRRGTVLETEPFLLGPVRWHWFAEGGCLFLLDRGPLMRLSLLRLGAVDQPLARVAIGRCRLKSARSAVRHSDR
jgi:hypothetical protein